MLHEKSIKVTTFKRSRSSVSVPLVLISAPNQYQSTMALSTGVAHPWDMDRPAKSRFPSPFFAAPKVLTAAENGHGFRRRQPRRMRQEIYGSCLFTCVNSR